ncbi:hypothetical protein HPP92_024590 [Vanilla planifolia]|uniref:Ribosomal protein L1 n=1 Tax=Vanilla planifolia TaxID=51239 RepID=A0A835PQ35_VANPL|nr:hypothetical protein HPP92_024590 [Vanilla planifolia]
MAHRASLSPSMVNREDAGRAVDALLNFLRSEAKKRKAQLFEHDDLLYLNLTVRRYPSTSRFSPIRIPLPHTIHPLDPSQTSLCLIVNDALADSVRSTASAENLPVDSVISLSELRTDYVPYESRRRLCNSYDIFFTDRRITPILPRLMGNFFLKKKKFPLAIDMDRKGWPMAIRQACRCTLLYLRSGTCSVLKVGRICMDREQILENVMAAIEGAVEHVPKKWANVRSFHIRASNSVALPIYQALPELGMKIDMGVQEGNGKRGQDERKLKKQKRSKKMTGRIHEVNYINFDVKDGIGEEHEHLAVDEDSDDLYMVKKAKKNNVEKGKKCKVATDKEADGEEKKGGGEFTDLDGKKKKRKRTKKIVDDKDVDLASAAEVGDNGEGKELHAKKKVRKIVKKGKDKEDSKGIHQGNSEDCNGGGVVEEATNIMNVDAVAYEDPNLKEGVKNNGKKNKGFKKVNQHKLNSLKDKVEVGTLKKKKSKALKSKTAA